MKPKALSFVARSGTGKTTLLEKLVPELKRHGLKVGVIKHDAHQFEIDYPGKDSHRLFTAGADAVLLASSEKLALIKRTAGTLPLHDLIGTYFSDMDLVLTEGYKTGPLPKIEVHRKERGAVLMGRGEERDPTLIAVASDDALMLDVPLLPLDDIRAIADFVMDWLQSSAA